MALPTATLDHVVINARDDMDRAADVYRPVTKWSALAHSVQELPDLMRRAYHALRSGKPGPVYLDLPSDVINNTIDESTVVWPDFTKTLVRARPQGDPALIEEAIKILEKAQKPVVLSGSGVLWSGAEAELRELVVSKGIPIYTTPQGRGVIAEDYAGFYAQARSTASACFSWASSSSRDNVSPSSVCSTNSRVTRRLREVIEHHHPRA